MQFAESRLFADCLLLYDVYGDVGRCVVCNLQKAGCSLFAVCRDGDRHEIERDSRGLAGGHATPRTPRVRLGRSIKVHAV